MGSVSKWWSPEMNLVFSLIALTLLRSEEHTSELQSHSDLVCRLLLEKKNVVQVDQADLTQLVARNREARVRRTRKARLQRHAGRARVAVADVPDRASQLVDRVSLRA